MIVVGQLGRIWAQGYQARRVYQTITAVGFYALMTKTYKDREDFVSQHFTLGEQSSTVNRSKPTDNQVRIKFKKLNTW